MKTIVITGSTRGIGYGLAESFLEMGHQVVINGRWEAGVEKTLVKLREKFLAEHTHGRAGDVRELEQVQELWDEAADRVETVTPWLAERVIANQENGARIRWLTRWKVIWRFLIAPFAKRDLFEREDVPH